jgi:Mlc titration factor MtfA (ptsG expression regulator)/Flp pilus assembly protein TadD
MSFLFGKARMRKFDTPFPNDWRRLLEANVLLFHSLSAPEQDRLCHAVRVLLAEKYWEGCAGLEMTDEVRVTIAGQAALLLLGFDDYYFDELQTVLVYPGGFLAVHEDLTGREDDVDHLSGQAHHDGPVILSWWDARWGGRRLGAMNVVLHEFAHKLAELGEPIAGKPPLLEPELASRWEEVVGPVYSQLVEDAVYGRPSLLDSYGAENRAEFFAVATEAFFLKATALRRRHPELYRLFAECYHQDPASRTLDEKRLAGAKEEEGEYARHAIAECTAALRHRPNFLEAYRERIGLYCALGEYDKALADCATLINPDAADENSAFPYFERGRVQREAGNLDAALADFDEAVRRDDQWAEAWCARGVARADRGELREALRDLTQAIRLAPHDDTPLIERALVHQAEGRLNKALRDLDRAIRLCPHIPDVWLHRARVHLERGDHAQALADCEEALRLDPDDEEALGLRASVLA